MTNLNLLPLEEKNELNQGIKNRLLIFYSIGPFFVLLIFIVLLFATLRYLDIYLIIEKTYEASLRSDINIKKYEDLELKIKTANERIQTINKIKNSLFVFSPFLKVFFDNLPSGFSLSSISYVNGAFNVQGSAEQKTNVLRLEKILKEDKKISNLKFPIENYFNLKEINFTFTIK